MSRRLKILALSVLLLLCAGLMIRVAFTPQEPQPAPVPPLSYTPDHPDTYDGPEADQLIDHLPSGGPAVMIPDLDVHSPMVSTGSEQGWLVLPDPPESTWYQQTQPVSASEGSTLIASHVDYGHGDAAPFGQLWRVEKGTPIFVRDESGQVYGFIAQQIGLHTRTGIPDEAFRLDGDRMLHLVTCSGPVITGEDAPFYEYNLVVSAVPLDLSESGEAGPGSGGDS